MAEEKPWYQDRWLWGALLVGLVLRVLPMVLWPQTECIRDECIYRGMALGIDAGKGLTLSTKGWLAAPGYPYTMAWTKMIFGNFYPLKWFQVGFGTVTLGFLYDLARRAEGLTAARIAVWLCAIHPTLAWFTNTWWIETLYFGFLVVAMWGVLWARDRAPWAMAIPAISLGITILYKGVATYLPPFFLLAALWPTEGQTFSESVKARYKSALVAVLACVLTVAPYSIHASIRHKGLVISDATAGHVLYLGNNDFQPVTFDYGNGPLTQPLYMRMLRQGRPPCDRSVPVGESNRCEVDAAVDWIKANPGEFLNRIPLRLAQQFNPNSFLTRHVRWGYWHGLPWYLKEGLALLIVLYSLLAIIGGTFAGLARGRGPYAWMAGGLIVYTCAASATMYGMTRFRLPIEPLWLIWVAGFLAHPKATFELLRSQPWRAGLALLILPPIAALCLWFLPTGFPMFW